MSHLGLNQAIQIGSRFQPPTGIAPPQQTFQTGGFKPQPGVTPPIVAQGFPTPGVTDGQMFAGGSPGGGLAGLGGQTLTPQQVQQLQQIAQPQLTPQQQLAQGVAQNLGGAVPQFPATGSPPLSTGGFAPQQPQPVSDGIPTGGGFPLPGPQAPLTGLIGSEQALQGALGGAQEALLTGAFTGREDIRQGVLGGLGQLGQARQDIAGQLGLGQGALAIAQQRAQGSIQEGQRLLQQGGQQAGEQFGQGVAALDPFRTGGLEAQQLQLARSGALGPEAQAQAFQQFTASPGQAFLQEQGELARTRQAAALGGLQGGNVLKELTRFGQGLAQQDLQRQFENLGALSGQGLTAAGNIGQLRGAQAGLTGELARAGGQLAGTGADISRAIGQSQGQLFSTGAELGQRLGTTGAGLLQQGGQNLAEIAGAAGVNVADLISGIGRDVSGGRLQAGRDIAEAIGGTTSGLSQLIQEQGLGLSDIVSGGAVNLGNILRGEGQLDAASLQSLAALLSAQQTGQVAPAVGLPQVSPLTPTSSTAGAALTGLGDILAQIPEGGFNFGNNTGGGGGGSIGPNVGGPPV